MRTEQSNQSTQGHGHSKKASSGEAITIVAGDFNGNPTSSYPYSEGIADNGRKW